MTIYDELICRSYFDDIESIREVIMTKKVSTKKFQNIKKIFKRKKKNSKEKKEIQKKKKFRGAKKFSSEKNILREKNLRETKILTEKKSILKTKFFLKPIETSKKLKLWKNYIKTLTKIILSGKLYLLDVARVYRILCFIHTVLYALTITMVK